MDTRDTGDGDQPVGYFPPPPGITPDFHHPRDVGHMAYLVGLGVCCGLTTVFFLIRAYVRLFVARRILLSDVTCLIGYLFALAHAGTAFTASCYGFGHPLWEVTRDDYTHILRWLYAASALYIPAAFFIKVTLLLLITHVFAIREKVTRGLYLFIYVLLIAYLPIQTLKMTPCRPVSAFWDLSATRFGCLNLRRLFITDLVVAVIADAVIVVVPIPIIWSMDLLRMEKIRIYLMLSAGAVAVGITVFRLVKISVVVTSRDISKDLVILHITTHLEQTIGLVCACLPSARILWQQQRSPIRRRSSNRPRSGHFLPREASATTRTKNLAAHV